METKNGQARVKAMGSNITTDKEAKAKAEAKAFKKLVAKLNKFLGGVVLPSDKFLLFDGDGDD